MQDRLACGPAAQPAPVRQGKDVTIGQLPRLEQRHVHRCLAGGRVRPAPAACPAARIASYGAEGRPSAASARRSTVGGPAPQSYAGYNKGWREVPGARGNGRAGDERVDPGDIGRRAGRVTGSNCRARFHA